MTSWRCTLWTAALAWAGALFMERQLLLIVHGPDSLTDARIPSIEAFTEWGEVAIAAFALGGVVGGLLFGCLSDCLARRRTLLLPIILYSLSALASTLAGGWPFMIGCFLVGAGVGGVWGPACTLVAESVPPEARARAGAALQAGGMLGSLAASAGYYWIFMIPGGTTQFSPTAGWRGLCLLGGLPAFIVVWLALRQRTRDRFVKPVSARSRPLPAGSILRALFGKDQWETTLRGTIQSSIAAAMFWTCFAAGGQLMQRPILAGYGWEVNAFVNSIDDPSTPQSKRQNAVIAQAIKQLAAEHPEYANPPPLIPKLVEGTASDEEASSVDAGFANVLDRAGDKVFEAFFWDLKVALPAFRWEGDESLTGVDLLMAERVRQLLRAEFNAAWLKGTILVTLGGLAGLVAFGIFAELFGRRPTFVAFFLGAFVVCLLAFQVNELVNLAAPSPLYLRLEERHFLTIVLLPLLGFFVLGPHTGLAIALPEMFPAQVRALGTSFCFSVGRLAAVPILFLWDVHARGARAALMLESPGAIIAVLFLLGAVVSANLKETRGSEVIAADGHECKTEL